MPYAELDDKGRVLMHEDATDSGAVDIRLLEATMVRPTAPEPVRPRAPTTSVAVSSTKQVTALNARDMVRNIRARLRDVEREIRARKSLEQERDQLKRLLVAVKQKPAPVRTIRAAG